jgi:hypothetical protein
MVAFRGIRPSKNPTTIVPCTQADLDVLEKVRRNLALRVTIAYDRSSPENRFWHALVGVVAEGLGKPPEILKLELKEHCQLWDNVFTSPVFGTWKQYKSVAFAAMSGPDFSDFRMRSVEILFTEYLPRVKRRDVYDRVREITGDEVPWID